MSASSTKNSRSATRSSPTWRQGSRCRWRKSSPWSPAATSRRPSRRPAPSDDSADRGDFAELREAHTLAWAHLWERLSIEFDDHADELRILRLHVLHLLQTVSCNSEDLDIGVPARGLHGEAYRGHIFWDELFIFPVLNLRLPTVTRSLLRYRYRRLLEARRAAKLAGYPARCSRGNPVAMAARKVQSCI